MSRKNLLLAARQNYITLTYVFQSSQSLASKVKEEMKIDHFPQLSTSDIR